MMLSIKGISKVQNNLSVYSAFISSVNQRRFLDIYETRIFYNAYIKRPLIKMACCNLKLRVEKKSSMEWRVKFRSEPIRAAASAWGVKLKANNSSP
jgi:hypothetical protein